MSNEQIMPCPHCGAASFMEEQDAKAFGAHRYAIYCCGNYCGATTALTTSPEVAIRYWNRRDLASKAEKAYPRLILCLKRLADTGEINFKEIDDLLKELGET